MKAGYKKSRRKSDKASKRKNTPDPASALADELAATGLTAEPSASAPEGGLSAKARKRRDLATKKTLRARALTLKKTKMSVRKGLARGVQGATNLTNNKLTQNMLKMAQVHEGQKQAASGKAAKKSKSGKQSGKAVVAVAALPTDVDMQT